MSLTTQVKWGSTVQRDQHTRLRLGYIFSQSPSTVTSSTGQVTVTAKLYAQTWNRMWDYQAPLSWSGSFGSGSTTVRFETFNTNLGWADSNIVLLRTFTRKVTASEANAIKTTLSASFRLAPTISSSATVSGTWTTAQKPTSIEPPYPIISANLTSFNGNTQDITINLTRDRQNSSTNPYAGIIVQWWTPDGDYGVTLPNGRKAQSDIGNTYEHRDTLLILNSVFRYRFRPYNSAGSASWTYSPFIYTRMDPPTSAKVVRNAGGGTRVTWARNAKWPTDSLYKPSFRVVWQELPAGSSTWSGWKYDEQVTIPPNTYSWVHSTQEPGVTYRYAVQAMGVHPEGVDNAYSDYAHTNTIALDAPPLTPNILGPNEGQRFGRDVTLSWEHNPQDGSTQSAYELEWWTDKEQSVRTVAQTSGAESVTIRPPQDNDFVRWRVRTKGVHPDFSPWTSVQAVGVSSPPTVSLVTTPGPYWGTSPELRATWVYTDPSGHSATKYEVRTTDASGKVVREYAGTTSVTSGGTAWSGSVPRIEDGQKLTVSVRVADSYGVFSDWAKASVTGDWAEPPQPSISAVFNEDTGTATLTVSIADGEPAADVIEVFRYLGKGLWERKTQGPGNGFVWEDMDPLFGDGTHNLYAARAATAYPSYTLSEVTMLRFVPEGCEEWFWLSSNRYPERRARFRGNASVDESAGSVKASVHHYGDRFPTSYTTLMNERKLSVAGMLDRRATRWQDWVDLGMTEGTFTFRDPFGRRLNVQLDPVNIGSAVQGYENVSFSLEVVEGPLDVAVGLEVPSNVLTEDTARMYAIGQGTGQTLEPDGVGLYELKVRDDARMSLLQDGHNLYMLVDWDNPTVEWCARDSER